MPYIAITSYPKDEETKNKLVDAISQAAQEVLGFGQDAFAISYEEVPVDEWDEKIDKGIVEARPEIMKLVYGEKRY